MQYPVNHLIEGGRIPMTQKCYNGRVLHVDLSNQKTRIETPPDAFYRTYGGGSAMGLYYILKEMPAGV
jgi:aldehyde:ferredoxin oxidoreductase